MLTDVMPMLVQYFPSGQPELSATDFDKALAFVKGRKSGSVPRPAPFSMDYAAWAHAMIVDWRWRVNEFNQTPLVGGATARANLTPKFLICPECEVMLVLDTGSGADVLMCPGPTQGQRCNRAIRVQTFVDLFKPAPKKSAVPPFVPSTATTPRVASVGSSIPKGASPQDYGVSADVRKSKSALIGWRMWDLRSDLRLRSLHYDKENGWLPMQPYRGTCSGQDPSDITDHVCPDWHFRCGIHAVKNAVQLEKWGSIYSRSHTMRIFGTIEMWGKVLEYEEGYRAEWAYPQKLFIPKDIPVGGEFALKFENSEALSEALWMTYLTEVVTYDDPDDIIVGGE